ncbi:hypothetical protein EGW08_021276 [Elysia chlorotica]|uniref:TIR domain-containing protein n=1 Tax=Elysia chlorotica TaxID=188477 RepID=A0A433SP85_ELYCH|nr:hypothetical protein EGW08_021276 [Elysia chlorotica]
MRLHVGFLLSLLSWIVLAVDPVMNSANQGKTSKNAAWPKQNQPIAGYLPSITKSNKFRPTSHENLPTPYAGLSIIWQTPKPTTMQSRAYSEPLPLLKFTKQERPERLSSTDPPNFSRVCPGRCHCTRSEKTVDVVDCSNKGLTAIPALPATSRVVNLQNNSITKISCGSFESLKFLVKLDLSLNNLTTLPTCSFTSLHNLHHLRLSQCQLNFLPQGVFNSLKNLSQLDLSENSLESIEPTLLTNLKKLESLDLSKNNLTKVGNGTFHSLNSLVFLSLQYNKLLYLSETFESNAFIGLNSLKSLHLEGNNRYLTDNFTYPDQALAQVPSLNRLWLDGYPRRLGPGFSSLVNLRHLIFAGRGGYCSMKSNMPIQFFSHLTTKQPLNLDLSFCEISKMSPMVLKYLPTIHTLDLASNTALSLDGFEKISQGLQNSTIKVLNISDIAYPFSLYNVIKNTTFQYLKQTHLTDLVVENCSLGNIDPQAILDLPQTIEYMSFQDNYLWKTFALYTITHLINLKTLKVSNQLDYKLTRNDSSPLANSTKRYNQTHHTHRTGLPTINNNSSFSMTDADVGTLFNAFQITNQRLCDDSKKEGRCVNRSILPLPPKLEKLYASDIKVSYNITEMWIFNNKALKYVDYSFNNVRFLQGPVHGLASLEYFDLSNNFCFRLGKFFFSEMPSMTTLILYNNRFGGSLTEDVEGITFSNLTNLEKLDLRANSIDVLSESAFKRNENLKVLDLSGNEIITFQTSLVNNIKLQLLDLSSNRINGLSERTCLELQNIKRNSPNFTARIRGNKFLCQCDNLYFLNFLLDHPEIFEDLDAFQCQLANWSSLHYGSLAQALPEIGIQCVAQCIFLYGLVAFFLVTAGLALFGLYHFKRWRWRYLYYVGQSRLHIGSTLLSRVPVANAFVTYDQENRQLRRMMKSVFLPRLHEAGITTVLGEMDFCGGPLASSIASAVTNTGKTLVFLSKDIFKDYHRQLEVNLAIMHELHMRSPVLVPVFLVPAHGVIAPVKTCGRGGRRPKATASPRSVSNSNHARSVIIDGSDSARFVNMMRDFPPEIATFLRGQIHRCLVYTRDTPHFWQQVKDVINSPS